MLTVNEVEGIARLARLALSEEEKVRYARQLSSILDYAAELARADLEGIPPTASVLPARSVLRGGDAIGHQTLSRTDGLANAPRSDGTAFVVPPTLPGALSGE